MAIEPVRIKDFEKWGMLVKTWATGRNYFEDGNQYPVPLSLSEFNAQLKMAGVEALIPDRIKAVQFVQANLETLLIRLPPGEAIRDSEKQFEYGGSYFLPAFYSRVFGGHPPYIPDADKLKFHAERIGDYTISNCM